jgi:membrane associated rhomboid family serine protease
MPPVTTALIVANVAVFLLQSIAPGIVIPFALWPLAASASGVGASFGPWQLLTYAFLHGGLVHLAFNMFALYMFGSAVEQVFGPRRYLIYYLVCVVSAAVSQLIVAAMMGGVYPTVGASGGVFGLLLAYGMYFPHNRVMLLFPPIPMPARVFVVVYAVIELYLGVTGSQAGVAHFAHLGGMIGGFIMLRYWRISAAIRRRDPRL